MDKFVHMSEWSPTLQTHHIDTLYTRFYDMLFTNAKYICCLLSDTIIRRHCTCTVVMYQHTNEVWWSRVQNWIPCQNFPTTPLYNHWNWFATYGTQTQWKVWMVISRTSIPKPKGVGSTSVLTRAYLHVYIQTHTHSLTPRLYQFLRRERREPGKIYNTRDVGLREVNWIKQRAPLARSG